MQLLAGTSGFDYAAWTGGFYPEELPAGERLAWYSSRLPVVEINATFYRLPKRDVVRGWAERSAAGFRFVLKASRRITHFGKLKDVEGPVGFLWKSAQELGEKRGPILFQLPPTMRADLGRLDAFLAALPEGLEPVLEVRHPSWSGDAFHEVLRSHGAALCVADSESNPAPEVVATAELGYLRLRREDYPDAELDRWAELLRQQSWERCYAFFKHEEGGVAPRFAQELMRRVNDA